MFIKVTNASTKLPLILPKSVIIWVDKSKGGITTMIHTGIQSPQGLLAFEVIESVDDIAILLGCYDAPRMQ